MSLKDAPTFVFNLVCGDSLIHGTPGMEQQLLGFHELAHAYTSEDLPELQRILQPGGYHAVVANPPYIRVKDKALNQAYRERYPKVCHRQYSVAVPFLQRLFGLARDGGFTGQITANSFMKREFGKKLVEGYLPTIDLTHVIDTSGAYIPGHGTPTVILFGRNRPPVAPNIRAVMGIKGEPATPQDPAKGLVWSAILDQIDRVGSQSAYVSVADTPRESFHRHPWSIGGGGAAELKELLDATSELLGNWVDSIGRTCSTQGDDIFVLPFAAATRTRIERCLLRRLIIGEEVRDWNVVDGEAVVHPYDSVGNVIQDKRAIGALRYLWIARTTLGSTLMFGDKTKVECGFRWYEYGQWLPHKLRTPLSITFAFVATHNHFVLDRGGKVFNRSAPVIKLPADVSEDDHIALLGLLNSSTACFWMKQIFHDKGSTVDSHGARQTTVAFENFREFTGTGLQQFPLPEGRPTSLSRKLDAMARRRGEISAAEATRLYLLPDAATPEPASANRSESDMSLRTAVAEAGATSGVLRSRMIAFQEELDWQVYRLYELIDEDLTCDGDPPPLELGQRAFEIVMGRKMAAGELETTWFQRHDSTPITDIPNHWQDDYRKLVERRIELIETDRSIRLIEQPEYKRRWNTEPWDAELERALRSWLLDRLERYFDLDGRMNDEKQIMAHAKLRDSRLTSVAEVADHARNDPQFMQVAELYVGRMDFDISNLVDELITAESVPALPVLRYKPIGLDKRAAWERTWDLQRLEDAVDALFEDDRLEKIAGAAKRDRGGVAKAAATVSAEESKKQKVARELESAACYVAEATKQGLNLDAETVTQPIKDAAGRAKKAVVGDIPVPPKYKSADFLNTNFWRLRGKLDVPKERWVSFPHCEGEDGTLVIAWAGYDHLQLARAIAERYELAKEQEGRKLVPLLAAIGQIIPWLKQWHNDLDPAYGTRMGDYYENYLAEEAKAIGKSVEEVMAWTPPAGTPKGRKRRTAKRKTGTSR